MHSRQTEYMHGAIGKITKKFHLQEKVKVRECNQSTGQLSPLCQVGVAGGQTAIGSGPILNWRPGGRLSIEETIALCAAFECVSRSSWLLLPWSSSPATVVHGIGMKYGLCLLVLSRTEALLQKSIECRKSQKRSTVTDRLWKPNHGFGWAR